MVRLSLNRAALWIERNEFLCFEEGASQLRRIETSLPGVFELRPSVFRDERGFFIEAYHRSKFAEAGVSATFVQDNHSCSSWNVLRGLHYQLERPQAKLCRVVEGQALDVAVDIRVGSPQFGKWTSVLLSAEQANQIYIPEGFAHGFLALSETVQFLYKCSQFYDPKDEFGILWSDPHLNISWAVETPLISLRDSNFPMLGRIPASMLPRYSPT